MGPTLDTASRLIDELRDDGMSLRQIRAEVGYRLAEYRAQYEAGYQSGLDAAIKIANLNPPIGWYIAQAIKTAKTHDMVITNDHPRWPDFKLEKRCHKA